MSDFYKECPNPDCQGLIAPSAVGITRWRRVPRGLNVLGMSRIHYVYCETCGRAFEIHEPESCGVSPKFHEYTDPDKVLEVRRKIAALNGTEVGGVVNCLA